MKKGEITEVNILSEKGGELKVVNPFLNKEFKCSSPYKIIDNIISIDTEPDQKITFNLYTK